MALYLVRAKPKKRTFGSLQRDRLWQNIEAQAICRNATAQLRECKNGQRRWLCITGRGGLLFAIISYGKRKRAKYFK